MSRANLSDKRRNLEVSTGFFAQRVNDRMLELSTSEDVWDTRRLSEELELNYEYLRKIVRGDALPSKQVVQLLSKLLDLDLHELQTLWAADKIKKDFGTIPLEIAGKNPELEIFDRLWDKCSDEHKKRLVSLLKEYAKQGSLSS